MNILFQGDSSTDAGRDRVHPRYMGNGYVSEIAIRLKNKVLTITLQIPQ